VLGHELTHVIRRHTVETDIFQEAVKDSSRYLDPAVLTHVTRIHEIEADREGIVMAFLAGYHPRGIIEFMEVSGKEMEIPAHLDHPTFEERVNYLEEFWTNDVKYAFVSFELGVAAMDRAGKLEGADLKAAVAAYDEAIEDFKRFQLTLRSNKQVLNDLGIALAKLGVLGMTAQDSPLGRWQTRFSLERDAALKYVGLVRDDDGGGTRGAGGKKPRLPWQLKEAIATFKEALAEDETYARAAFNLAGALLAAGKLDEAEEALGKVKAGSGVTSGEVDLLRGVIEAERKQYDKAKASFDKALVSKATKQAAAYDLARCLALAGKKDEAKKAYQAYAKSYPTGPWAKAATAAASKL
jgi:tetratricopeptide (TPR) repeat protein